MFAKYNEKLVEEIIKEFPKEFLGEELAIVSQQPAIGGFRPDLIFKNCQNHPVIVEIQINALDRTHLYRSIEYRDIYRSEFKCNEANIILFCNTIPKKYLKILEIHSVKCISISKLEFIRRLKKLKPHLTIKDSKQKKLILGQATIRKILKALFNSKTKSNGIFTNGTFAFWINNVLESGKQRMLDYPLDKIYPLEKRIARIRTGKVRWSNSPIIKPSTYINSDVGKVDFDLPFEHFIHGFSMDKLDEIKITMFMNWIEIFYPKDSSDSHKIHLGSCHSPLGDIFQWENYITGQKGIFGAIGSYYGETVGYNEKLIKNDLDFLSQITVYLGKSPNFHPTKLFKSYSIIPGPDSRETNTPLTNEYHIKSEYIKRGRESELKEMLREARKEWLTIELKGMSQYAAAVMYNVLSHMEEDRRITRKSYFNNINFDRYIIAIRDASEIPRRMLQLSSKYFTHITDEEPSKRDQIHP